MWKCPNCNRSFQSKNQWHSCVIVTVDDLFFNSEPNVIEIFEALQKQCKTFCDFSIDTTKSCLYFVDPHRFLAVKPKKSGIILEYMLNRTVDVFPVIKVIQVGKFRFAHRLAIDNTVDLNKEVISWIEEAHRILKQ